MNEVMIGGGAVTVVITGAGLMLRHILARADAQDKSIKELDRAYHKVMENHLTHNTSALVDLKNAVQELLAYLKRRD